MFDKILQDIGISSESINSIRLGRGVVGKSANVAIAALVVLSIAASRISNDYLLIGLAVCAIFIFVWFFKGSMGYADRNPAAALLEGAELVTWRKQELAAKDMPNPPKSQTISDIPPPHQIDSGRQ